MTSEQAQRRADLIKRLEGYREKRARMLAELDAERDGLIREAKADDMSNTEVADHMGAGRNTVIRVLGSNESQG
jgi:DNA invertase Pin-like site-specific DNA recombinase